MYLEVNNLDHQTVSQWLPLREFKLLTDQEIGNLGVHKIPSASDYENNVEVVSEYPKELYELNNCYQLSPEQFVILTIC